MILLTGATGFVGRRVARALLERGKPLRCLVRQTSNLAPLQGLDLELAYGDVTDPASLPAALDGVDTVIHLVAVIREQGEATFRRVNFFGTSHLVEAAKQAGVSTIFHMSNIGAGSDPRYPFLYSKGLAEQEVINSGLAYTIFRASLMFGEGDEFYSMLADIVRRFPVVPVIGPGSARFQPISVEEVAHCIALAVDEEGLWGHTVSLGGPEHLTYEQIIDIIIDMLRVSRWKVHVPLFFMRPVAAVMEALLPRPPVTSVQLSMLSIDNVSELDAVEKAFGFRPTSFREGAGYLVARKGRHRA